METMFNPILYQYIDGSMSLEDVENMVPEYKVDPSKGKLAIVGNANDPFIIPYNAVVDILINNTYGGGHPMHFHGHKF
jgi:FtsP/CotA-like multicopper oxidase with cupredoxin domain